jgi:hypothetical protein
VLESNRIDQAAPEHTALEVAPAPAAPVIASQQS